MHKRVTAFKSGREFFSAASNYQKLQYAPIACIIKETGTFRYGTVVKGFKKSASNTDLDTLAPADHLLRQTDRVMDYD